ncbi:zinc-binding protein A33-like [Scyliorhinus canicula]|uniref:zinc-binding protein A33-like n=1 Tax=Scyliorhinus canicula TaxID=7830 RepID=UPI0018F50B6D|nr:zinc-binding protein A33-like [Scyliorhinus canicula]
MTSQYPMPSRKGDFDCGICGMIVADGVALDCGHVFCRDCTARYNQSDNLIFCPECKLTVKRKVPLSNEHSEGRFAKTTSPQEDQKVKKSGHPICEEHQEEVKLFCETERKLICVNCLDRRDGKSHTAHNFMLLNEAIDMYKGKINRTLLILRQKKTSYQDFELKQQENISGIKEQSNKLQTLIDYEFSKLRSMLDEKERKLVNELNTEKDNILDRMETNLREIQGNSHEIQQKLSDIEMQLTMDDGVTLLMENTYDEPSEEDYQPTLADGSLNLGEFQGPIQYKVWRHVTDLLNPDCTLLKKGNTS